MSTSTDQELQAMLEDDSASEITKVCIKEEINFRKGGPNNEQRRSETENQGIYLEE